MTTQNTGFSKRSLLLLGGLTAVATNPTARQKLLGAVHTASDTAQSAYQDTVKPLAQQAQKQLQVGVSDVSARAQELAQVAAERGSELAQIAAERGSELAHVAAERGGDLASKLTEQGSGVAAGVAALAAEHGGKLAANLGDSVSDLREKGGKQAQALFSTAQDKLGDVQEQVQGTASQARKDGGKVVKQQVRQGHKQAMKLQKELAHEVNVRSGKLEKLSGKKRKQAEKELAELKKRSAQAQKAVQKNAGQTLRRVKSEPEPRGSAMTTVLVSTGLLIGGGVLLARVPAVRHAILRAVGTVSPEAAEALHAAGTNVRDIVGSVWLERIEPETAAQAPAPKPSQATGSAAYASVEPGAPAQSTAPAPQTDAAKPADSKPDDSKAASSKN